MLFIVPSIFIFLSIDTTGVIERVKKLFHGHPELVHGFNNFLPTPLKIGVNAREPREEDIRVPDGKYSDKNDPQKAEFDHARSYVKKIKQRFHEQPHIYKSFLDILHTFSREQQTLHSVYDGVAKLFKDHKDLLQEFKHFLPETSVGGVSPDMVNLSQSTQRSRPTRSRNVSVDKKPSYQESPPPSYSYPRVYPRQVNNMEASYGTYDELHFFFKIKQALPVAEYEEFLKVLSMYNMEIITKAESYYLVRDLLRYTDPELITWFRNFLQADDIKDDDDPSGYLADFDWSRSEKLGPSYRSIPEKWKQWKCSGRVGNALCIEVLNDSWLSVPTGSEDGTFKNSRKNQYEELLFKLEDDRYELDLMVECNMSTIRYLEDVYLEMEQMTQEELARFELDESKISIIHINAIKRVFGNKGNDFVRSMIARPVAVIPIVLNRLKQKDIEWNISRNEWNELWKEIASRNHYKAFDHRSVGFKQEEKKTLLPKALLSELRKKSAERKALIESEEEKSSGLLDDPLLSFEFSDKNIFEDIKLLLMLTFESVIPKGSKTKLESFYNELLVHFFNLPKPEVDQIKSDPLFQKDQEVECKPIVTSVETDKQCDTNLFLGNDTFYLMFRYLYVLYNRLQEAWELAKGPEPVRYKPQPEVEAEEALKEELQNNKMEEQEENNEVDYQKKRYQQFLYNIELLLSNTIEQSAFEDKCRLMFGNYCYPLFTVDKLLVLLAKQIHSIQADETAEKLLGLYHYELSKPNGFTDCVYFVNYREVMSGEKKAFVFTYDLKANTLGIKDVDLSSASMTTELHEELSRYVNTLVLENRDISEFQSMKPPLFLKRTIQEKASLDESHVDMSYGLACKVTTDNYKLRFVENTEDFFRRYKKVQSK